MSEYANGTGVEDVWLVTNNEHLRHTVISKLLGLIQTTMELINENSITVLTDDLHPDLNCANGDLNRCIVGHRMAQLS